MFFCVFVSIVWLISGYAGSMSELFSVELMLNYFMMLMWITMCSVYFIYFLVTPKGFQLLIYSYVFILTIFFTVNNLLVFYIMFELSILPIFFIILGWGNQPERMMSTNYLLLYTMIFSLPFLVLMLIFVDSLSSVWSNFMHINLSNKFYFLILLPFLVKMPICMFHLWLPKAHVEAPTLGSMFLASILLKTGGFGLMKMVVLFHLKFEPYIYSVFIFLVLTSSLMCMAQSDVKKYVAYSSVVHMTMAIPLIVTNSYYLINGMVVLMISHSFISNAMFFVMGYMSNNSKSRVLFFQQNYISMIPFMWFMFLSLCIFNCSFPPSLSMISEIMFLMNSIYIWYGNMFLSVIVFFSLLYYCVWFVLNLNTTKNFIDFFSKVMISDIMIVSVHLMWCMIFWVNSIILI